MIVRKDEPLGRAVVEAIHQGDVEALKRLLDENPGLASARIGGGPEACRPEQMTRTLLHVVTDWPGYFPNGAASVAVLVDAGADVNARFTGPHTETPLHWAASSDDVEVLDALLDRGADIEAPGAVIAGGTPLGMPSRLVSGRRRDGSSREGRRRRSGSGSTGADAPHRDLRIGRRAGRSRGHDGVLWRVSRKRAQVRRVPPGSRGRSQLDRIRRLDTSGCCAAERRRGAGELAPRARSQGRRPASLGAGSRTFSSGHANSFHPLAI